MRARLAVQASGCRVELREIVLREKPEAFLAVSPSATVPCLVTQNVVLDESLDIMFWALKQCDTYGWLDMPAAGFDWITRTDGPFKHALDHTKYANRYPEENATDHRAQACDFLADLEGILSPWMFDKPSVADFAILPFVRQFAFIDKPWFDAQPWPKLHKWLEAFLGSAEFDAIMYKYPQWHPNDTATNFPIG